MAELTKAQLRLWVYDGDAASPPLDPSYTLTKTKLTGEESIVFEISELIKDHVEIKFDGNYEDIKQTMWVKSEVTRTYSDTTFDTKTEHALAFRGYGELTDGINPELSKKLLISNTVIHNYCGYDLTVPTFTGKGGLTKVKYESDTESLYINSLGSANQYTIDRSSRINPPADDIITIDKTASLVASPDDSSSIEGVPIGTTKITFTDPDGTEGEISIECIEECMNTPHKISFINKFGVMQDIWFFAKRKDSISSEREQYKKNTLAIGATGASYNISDHQRVYLENQGRESITMNTGFIHESYNEVMKQLLVSEYVYIHDNTRYSPTNAFYDLAIPISVVTNSLEFKTKRNDKLINYELQFEMDSEFIQSIR